MERLLALLHPLVIHFPIALLLAAAFLELVRHLKPAWNPAQAIAWNLHIGTAGVLMSVATGWSRAGTMGFAPELKPVLWIHRWAGVATLAVTLLLLFFWWAEKHNSHMATPFRFTMFATVILIGVTAHHGGLLVYGTDYYSDLAGKLIP